MALTSGTKLGPYEIQSPLGAGGMGEVYRARDTRLNRIVAIKVLPAHLSERAESRQRFEREARAISGLSDPHICSLYDIGHQDGTDYLVMEYLEGETLAQRLARGPLPLDQVLKLGVEIANALDKAHRHGIVHRDLKPGNVMLTKTGSKLLDFGLAKLTQGASPAAGPLSQMPTAQGAITAQGTILGTLQYMAPEQLEGKETNARTDIFALGAVLYEMVTGKKAFEGKSQASLIAAILEREPPRISSLQPMTPPALDRVVRTCLAKDPDARWQSAGDLTREMQWIAQGGSQAGIPAPVVSQRKNREKLAWVLAAALAILCAVFVVRSFRPEPKSTGLVTATINLPEGVISTDDMALSPDGMLLALVTDSASEESSIWVRPLDSPAARKIAGTKDAQTVFWSPDSRSLGFIAEGKIQRVDLAGGAPQVICDASLASHATWNRQGVVLFSKISAAIQRVSANGGKVTSATSLDASRTETAHRRPVSLPDGDHFLYEADGGSMSGLAGGGNSLYVASLSSSGAKLLGEGYERAVYVEPGYVVFARLGQLMAQPFDQRSLEFTGEAVPIGSEPIAYDWGGGSIFTVSGNGVLAYKAGNPVKSQYVWLDRKGKETGRVGAPGYYELVRISPDGKRIAYEVTEPPRGVGDIWIYDQARGTSTRFTFLPSSHTRPVWSPDGALVEFGMYSGSNGEIYVKPSDGSAKEKSLPGSSNSGFVDDWSSDGRLLLFVHWNAANGGDLWTFPLSGEQKPHPFLETPYVKFATRFSPDMHWVAYTSSESGRQEIYVVPFPEPGGKWQISTAGGTEPRWRRDGKELFFVSLVGRLMSADVGAKGSVLEAEIPKILFKLPPGSTFGRWDYDVTADGQRFLFNIAQGEKTATPVTLLVNWAAELKKK